MKYQYKTKGVCASTINFELEDGKVKNVAFTGGCNGNLKALSKVIDGMDAEKVIETFKGIECGMKKTSCSDQLSKAVEQAYNESKENKE